MEKKSCGECSASFNAFRPACVCANCEKLFCNGELCGGMFSSPSVAGGARFPLCGSCAPVVMLASPSSAKGSGRLNLGEVRPALQFAGLSPQSQSALALKGQACEICRIRYDAVRTQQGVCSVCSKAGCPTCLGNYTLPSLGVVSQPICSACTPELKQRLLSSQGGISDAQKQMDFNLLNCTAPSCSGVGDLNLSSSELVLLRRQAINCNICNASLGLCRPPHRCAVCAELSDADHVAVFPLYNRLNHSESAEVCKACWPRAKAELSALTLNKPELKTATDLEIGKGDEWSSKATIPSPELNVNGNSECNVCADHFDLGRLPRSCTRCNALCHASGCGINVPAASGGADFICSSCRVQSSLGGPKGDLGIMGLDPSLKGTPVAVVAPGKIPPASIVGPLMGAGLAGKPAMTGAPGTAALTGDGATVGGAAASIKKPRMGVPSLGLRTRGGLKIKLPSLRPKGKLGSAGDVPPVGLDGDLDGGERHTSALNVGGDGDLSPGKVAPLDAEATSCLKSNSGGGSSAKAASCTKCEQKFGLFRTRKVCASCGDVNVCGSCCKSVRPAASWMKSRNVCKDCQLSVLSGSAPVVSTAVNATPLLPCRECKSKFRLARSRASTCSECHRDDLCSVCCHSLSGGIKLCKACWPKKKGLLKTQNPAAYSDGCAQFDGGAVDKGKEEMDESTGISTTNCAICQSKFGMGIKNAASCCCENCRRQTCVGCANAVCVQDGMLHNVCSECCGVLKNAPELSESERRELQLAFAGGEGLWTTSVPFSPEEIRDIQSVGVCSVCSDPFSSSNGPSKCASCGLIACEHDVIKMPLYNVLAEKRGPVCRMCWPQCRALLEDAAAKPGVSREQVALIQSEIENGGAWSCRRGALGTNVPLDSSCFVCQKS